MLCKSCGMEIPDHAAFCPKCGAKTSIEAPVTREGGPPAPPQRYNVNDTGKKTSGLAIASLVTGIVGMLCFPIIMPILAIIFGLLAKSEIKKSSGRIEGSGLATTGIILGIIALVIPLILAAVFIPLIVNNVGETRTINRSVMLNGATSIEGSITMHTGSLEVTGGSAPGNMMEGTFKYNVSRWKPDIDHSFSGSTGQFTAEQPRHWLSLGLWKGNNRWQIRLNKDVPVKLSADLTSVDSALWFGDINNLESLKVNTASGNVNANLGGDKQLLKSINTKVTSGNTDLDLSGAYYQPVDAIVKSTSGNIKINLNGSWAGNLDLAVAATSGNITITLPKEIGVYVTASVTSGDINADELNMREKDKQKTYSNDAYEKTDVTLFIDARTTSGNINLEVAE